jgi:hypothetical protein
MANTPVTTVAVPDALRRAANAAADRAGAPELGFGVLVRAGLALLASASVDDVAKAIKSNYRRPGPMTREGMRSQDQQDPGPDRDQAA